MKLLFIRHGESEANLRGVFAGGDDDTPLTDIGRGQAIKAGRSIFGEKIDAIISSPLSRTKETAQLVAQENKMKLKGVVCVSVFHDNALKWDANSRLFDVALDWQKIRENVQSQIVCMHSDDDPYIPIEQAQFVADSVGAEWLLLPGQGHFNLEKSAEFVSFPALLTIMDKRIMV